MENNEELTELIISYEGVLPIEVKALLDDDGFEAYTNNLKRKNIYEEVYDEYYQIRVARKKSNDREKFDKTQYNTWLKQNPKFKEYLKPIK